MTSVLAADARIQYAGLGFIRFWLEIKMLFCILLFTNE